MGCGLTPFYGNSSPMSDRKHRRLRCAARTRQTRHSGQVIASPTSPGEVEELRSKERRNDNALTQMQMVDIEQQRIPENITHCKRSKSAEDKHIAVYRGQIKGTGGLAGWSRKSRGVSAASRVTWSLLNKAFCRKRPLIVLARDAIGKKLQNGVGGRTALKRCVTPVTACGLRYAKWIRRVEANKAASLVLDMKVETVLESEFSTSISTL